MARVSCLTQFEKRLWVGAAHRDKDGCAQGPEAMGKRQCAKGAWKMSGPPPSGVKTVGGVAC